MDVDDLLDPNELPETSVDVDQALAATLRRGRSRRRRFAGGALLAAAVMLGGAVTLAVRDTGDDALRVTTDPPASTSSVPSTPEPGDEATWTVHDDRPPSPDDTTFVAQVTRMACSGGVTGQVLRPGVDFTGEEIVVTFTVGPSRSGSATCQGNRPSSYVVELGQPIGRRMLVDGRCIQRKGAPTIFCKPDGVRWRPTPTPAPAADARECAGRSNPDTDVATEPNWRRHADYVPWTNRDGCLVRIDVVAERPGPAHCGWEEAQVLILGRPLGTRYTTPDDTDEYVRDPGNVFGLPDLGVRFSADATLPGRAVDSGYRSEGRSLWYDPDDSSAVWLVSADGVERWPAGEPPLCM